MTPGARAPGRLLCLGGAPGAGKTTVGRLVAATVGAALVDLDSVTTPLLEAFAASLGEPADLDSPRLAALRGARYACLAAVVADGVRAGVDVVAVAPFTAEAVGGSWGGWGRAAGAASVTTCWLELAPSALAARVEARGLARDLAKAAGAASAPVVDAAAVDLHVDAGADDPDGLARRVLEGWAARA